MDAEKCRGNYCIIGAKLCKSTALTIPENLDTNLYEVLKVLDGKPLFWQRHYSRLMTSVRLANLDFTMDSEDFYLKLRHLIQANGFLVGNIRIDLFHLKTNENSCCLYFVPHHYPSSDDYTSGVEVELLQAEREDPLIKKVQTEVRSRANEMIANHSCFEVLLVDKEGLVLEGSRSNVFFIKGKKLFSAADDRVLHGVTRTEVLQTLGDAGIPVEFGTITKGDLENFDAVFLTGTSINVLPVCRIGLVRYDVENPVLLHVRNLFDQVIENYLQKN